MELSDKAKEVVAMYRGNVGKQKWGEISLMSKEELQAYYDHCNNEIQRLYLLSTEEIHAVSDFPIREAVCIMEDMSFLHGISILCLKLINGLELDELEQELIVE